MNCMGMMIVHWTQRRSLSYRGRTVVENHFRLIDGRHRSNGRKCSHYNDYSSIIIVHMQSKNVILDSINQRQSQNSCKSDSQTPLSGFLSKANSIMLSQEDETTSEIMKSSEGTHEKQSIMSNIPLLLEKRKNGIVEENLGQENKGIEKWKMGKMIGGGASGHVFKALNINNGILSAVKKIHLLEGEEEESKSEIAILSKMHHENIVRYLQHYHLPHQTCIFMEYVPGTLKNFYKDFGPPPIDTFLNFAKQLVTALDYLHRHKIFHKDLKCANVLLTSKGVLKLTDFGCSKDFERTMSMRDYQKQGSKTFKGTILWMAPESITDSIYSRKTDIWSLGCTLLQLATGTPPWSQKNMDPGHFTYFIGTTEELPLIPEHLDPFAREIMSLCFKRNPEERISTEELLQLLTNHKQHQ